MRTLALYSCLLPLVLCGGQTVVAQDDAAPQDPPKVQETAKAETAPAHYYHLDFAIQEIGPDGKPANSRSYGATISTGTHEFTSIRNGSRVPVPTSETQFQYTDVGVNIDARDAHELGKRLALSLTADVSSFAASQDPSVHQPVIRNYKWQGAVLIPVGKATVVYTSDVVDGKGSLQLVLTATQLQ